MCVVYTSVPMSVYMCRSQRRVQGVLLYYCLFPWNMALLNLELTWLPAAPWDPHFRSLHSPVLGSQAYMTTTTLGVVWGFCGHELISSTLALWVISPDPTLYHKMKKIMEEKRLAMISSEMVGWSSCHYRKVAGDTLHGGSLQTDVSVLCLPTAFKTSIFQN